MWQRILLTYLLPIVIQGLTPIISEYVKKAVEYLTGHLPSSVMLVLASTIAEGVNQAQAALSGASLPPGVGAIIAIFLNELGNDFHIQPPTPGIK